MDERGETAANTIPWGKAAVSLVVALPAMVWSDIAYFSRFAGPPGRPRPSRPAVSAPATDIALPSGFASLDDIAVVFDPDTGEPLVWYSGDLGEGPRFFTHPGYDPRTGQALSRLDRQALARYRSAYTARQRQDNAAAAAAREAAFREPLVDGASLAAIAAGHQSLLLAVDDEGFERLLATALHDRGVPVRTGVLKSAVFEKPVYDELTGGSASLLGRLHLSGRNARLLLATLTVEAKQNRQLRQIVTATARLSATVVPLDGGAPTTVTVSEPGAAFDAPAARAAAEHAAIDKLLDHPAIRKLTP